MKTYKQRINNIIGQLEGISKMIDNDIDSCQIINQIKASKSALNSFLQKYSEENILKCLKLSCKDEAACKRFINEIIKN